MTIITVSGTSPVGDRGRKTIAVPLISSWDLVLMLFYAHVLFSQAVETGFFLSQPSTHEMNIRICQRKYLTDDIVSLVMLI